MDADNDSEKRKTDFWLQTLDMLGYLFIKRVYNQKSYRFTPQKTSSEMNKKKCWA